VAGVKSEDCNSDGRNCRLVEIGANILRIEAPLFVLNNTRTSKGGNKGKSRCLCFDC
jgi:hypothetical protein